MTFFGSNKLIVKFVLSGNSAGRNFRNSYIYMEVEKIIEKKEIVHDDGCKHKEYATKGLAGTALGFGIGGAVLGAAALWGRRGGGFGGGGMPENININTISDAISGRSGAPTAFQAWDKSCEDALALTNAMWGLKVNTQEQMYAHRETDVREKFGLYQSQVQGDFGNYKAIRDLYDTLNERYSEKFCDLDKKVYGMEIANMYQNKIIQMGLGNVLEKSVNYTDRKTCKALYGVVGLPSTPTVTVLEGADPCGNRCNIEAPVVAG